MAPTIKKAKRQTLSRCHPRCGNDTNLMWFLSSYLLTLAHLTVIINSSIWIFEKKFHCISSHAEQSWCRAVVPLVLGFSGGLYNDLKLTVSWSDLSWNQHHFSFCVFDPTLEKQKTMDFSLVYCIKLNAFFPRHSYYPHWKMPKLCRPLSLCIPVKHYLMSI